MRSRLAAAFAAVRDLLRGFVGATRLAHDPKAVRVALARRAEQRRSCC